MRIFQIGPFFSRALNRLTRSVASKLPRHDSRQEEKGDGPAPRALSSDHDPYRGVILVLLAASFIGTIGILAPGWVLGNWVLLDATVSLGLSIGILAGLVVVQIERAKLQNLSEDENAVSNQWPSTVVEPATAATILPVSLSEPKESDPNENIPKKEELKRKSRPATARINAILVWFEDWGLARKIAVGTALAGILANIVLFRTDLLDFRAPTASLADGIAATFCLCGALLVATAARFLADTEPSWLPEGPSLSRGARVLAWILVLASLSIGLSLEKLDTLFKVTHFALLALNTAICWSLLTASWPSRESASIFPLNFGVLQVFGSRTNIVGSVLDSAEKQLGIDLRSTWALNVVRRALEPLALGLLLIGWISTSFSVVGVQEQGLVERLGIPVGGEPLAPGLHLHWPWPIDKVYRIAMLRVQAVQVGHEGEEEGGPENVIWAVEHAPNEYALLLGNGRDLITVDATVQYRITDARAWRYHAQNPEEALKAISYRAVMRSTVNLTLSEALSQNLTALTAKMREMVQKDATALGLGVDIVAFTVGGMHPPVPVAADYEAVVSAELGKVTSVVNAQAARNRSVPAARASVVEDENKARAEGAQVLAVAAGEAWSFRTLESQYKASPGEYFFRRRLETLEAGLAKRRFTILDSRFERDGGEIWLQQ